MFSSKNSKRARPCALARYMAASASRISVSGESVPVPTATPTLTLRNTSCPLTNDPPVTRVLVVDDEAGLRRALARVEAAASGGRVSLSVVDRGPGIPAAERERVFQPFQRHGDHPAAGTGVGLGLAIARGFLQAMHGGVEIEETPGGGATLVISLEAADGGLVPSGS